MDDEFAEETCREFYAEKRGRPGKCSHPIGVREKYAASM